CVDVIYVSCPSLFFGQLDLTIPELMVVLLDENSPRLGPLFQVFELDTQNRALEAFHSVVIPTQQVMVFPVLAPIAQHAHSAGVFGIVSRDCPTFPVSPQVLPRIEAEARHVPDTPNGLALVFR